MIDRSNTIVKVGSLDDAYKQGYFSGGISRDTLIEAIIKKNPSIWVHHNETHCGLFYYGRSICGISKLSRIPKFTLQDRNTGKILCRSWKKIITMLKGEGYEVDEDILNSY